MDFKFLTKLIVGLNDKLDQQAILDFIKYFDLKVGKKQEVSYTIQKHISIHLAFTINEDLNRITVYDKTYITSVGGYELAYNDLHHAQEAIAELQHKALGSYVGIHP